MQNRGLLHILNLYNFDTFSLPNTNFVVSTKTDPAASMSFFEESVAIIRCSVQIHADLSFIVHGKGIRHNEN